MANVLVLCAVALTLVASASASSVNENIVLFAEDKDNLQVQYGNSLSAKKIRMNFYEYCIDPSPNVCHVQKKGDETYMRYFAESNKKECMEYEQVAESLNNALQFCVDMENSSWYGGAEVTRQYWPLNKFNWTDRPFVTREEDSQAVVESYFFNSDGFYIHVDDSVALFVDINGPRPGHMCFTAKVVAPYRKPRNAMRFRVCKFGDPRQAHENAIEDFLGTPKAVPDAYVVQNPIWSTWARYKCDVNSDRVRSYAQEIVKNGFPRGTLEIDDKWETCYGSAQFNTSRFENIKGLVKDLKALGFKTSLWTHPFINLECTDKHSFAKNKGYFVNSTTNTVDSTWWNGKASYIDFTNPEAANWWSSGLRDLLAKSGIDTFKFDAGEFSWTPQLPDFYDKDLTYYPDNIVNAYLKTIVSFGDGIEYRASRRSQEFGRFLRMIDRESRWDYWLGLPTLITSLLHLNMIGYPFVLPDMIGGNGYNNTPPSKEMYIRWMQANTFMPAVQFSYTPWDFDQQTVDVCKKLLNIRNNYTATIIQLMKNSVAKGSPVNAPIWWIDPTDSEAHEIAEGKKSNRSNIEQISQLDRPIFVIDCDSSKYLLGENILVAPVVVENATSRDVYLPAGEWRDENNPRSRLISGRTWLRNYPAGLEVLPWFTKVSDSPASSTGSGVSPAVHAMLLLSLIVYLFQM